MDCWQAAQLKPIATWPIARAVAPLSMSESGTKLPIWNVRFHGADSTDQRNTF
jgi:hypothetical protein